MRDIYSYRQERIDECEGKSLYDVEIDAAEEAGTGGAIGRIIGRASLDGRTWISMHEIVEIHPHYVHRTKYAYYLFQDDGVEIGAYERDPLHAPDEEHRHCTHRDGAHYPGGEPAPRVTFEEAADLAWEWYSEHGRDDPL